MRQTFAKIEFRMCYVFLVQSTIHNLIQRIQVKVKCYCLIYIAQLLESIIQSGRNIKCRHKSCLTKLTRLGHLYQIKSPIQPELLIIYTILHILIVFQIHRKLIHRNVYNVFTFTKLYMLYIFTNSRILTLCP